MLKDEVAKVRKLNPDRYILSTSVGLTPENKAEIMTMFSPYIKATKDILGRNDLNNLLGEYSEVEKQYYKLWLGSTAVLDDILNKRINNWSEILALSKIDIAKCTIDLSSYTEEIRASILYNHLADAELPIDYIRALLVGKRYLKHKVCIGCQARSLPLCRLQGFPIYRGV